MALVNQDVSVPCLALLHVDDSLVSFLERSLLNPRVYVLLDSQL